MGPGGGGLVILLYLYRKRHGLADYCRNKIIIIVTVYCKMHYYYLGTVQSVTVLKASQQNILRASPASSY